MLHPTTTSYSVIPPEVQGLIASFVCRPDLRHCVRVCREWREVFTPFFWRHVQRSDDQYDWGDQFLQSIRTGCLRKYSRHIRSIDIEGFDDELEEILEHSPRTFPQLTSLRLLGLVKKDALIADMIQRCSGGLQSFVCDLDDCDYGREYFGFGQKSAKAILEHVSTLEVFRVEDPYLKSSQIQQLLCTAPRLKEFNILTGDCDGWSQGLEAMDVVASDWVCKNLTVFGCHVRGIPRPDIVRTICGGPSSDYTLEGTIQESINIQRQVYSQFARLNCLRELRLGAPCNVDYMDYRERYQERDQQYDCLAMSLDSGLDLLGGLKHLRVVGLEDMEMDIYRDKEAAWAKQHWPLAEILTTVFTLYEGDASEFDASSDEFAIEDDYDDYSD
ncbi:MAG: hypothetical protein J3R72DRAFT_445035 [Linnemannia gamsii]|nr:MAG: hypothetical protein J3R72DRAFT_445035 [Linnemannia gamsii]